MMIVTAPRASYQLHRKTVWTRRKQLCLHRQNILTSATQVKAMPNNPHNILLKILTYLRSFYWSKSLIYGFRLILTQKFPLKSMVFF